MWKRLAVLMLGFSSCLLVASCPNISLGIPLRRMPSGVGQNLWNIGWGNTWHDYFKEGIDWTTVDDPWHPGFLDDLANFKGPVRFMDWDEANENPIVSWSDRAKKTDDHYTLSYGAGKAIPIGTDQDGTDITTYYESATSFAFRGVAYEWMIDLCNRTGHDLWICVPIFADDDYCRNLAELIDATLDRDLKVYLEYANETWNPGISKAFLYHRVKAVEKGLPTADDDYLGPSAFSIYRSLEIFRIFQSVFGDKNTGIDRRLVRVICAMGNEDFCSTAIRNIIYDGTEAADYRNVAFNPLYNSDGQRPDAFGYAPYVGAGVDGASSTTIQQWDAALEKTIGNLSLWKEYVIDRYDFPLVAYEGGQHLTTNADVFSSDSRIYYKYLEYMDTWKERGYIMFVHYALYSQWTSGNAWGAKEGVTSEARDSHKFRALVDWQAMNP